VEQHSPHEQKHQILQIIMHPKYNSTTADHDVALLRLRKKATFTSFVRPVCFPDSSISFSAGEECYVTGWGDLFSDSGNFSRVSMLILSRCSARCQLSGNSN